MCDFVDGANLLPGWTCCRCRTYNGLQRPKCRRCSVERHAIVLPVDLIRCECGFGLRAADRGNTARGCPVDGCGRPLPERVEMIN